MLKIKALAKTWKAGCFYCQKLLNQTLKLFPHCLIPQPSADVCTVQIDARKHKHQKDRYNITLMHQLHLCLRNVVLTSNCPYACTEKAEIDFELHGDTEDLVMSSVHISRISFKVCQNLPNLQSMSQNRGICKASHLLDTLQGDLDCCF